jgi:hypothetical protein
MKKDKLELLERRNYIRTNTLFPVEFQVVDKENNPLSYIFEGFTENVGTGGICVEARTEKGRDVFKFIPKITRLKVIVNIPSSELATVTYATVRWLRVISEPLLDTCLFGIEYEEIGSDRQKMIQHYVLWLNLKPKLILMAFIILVTAVVFLTYLAIKPV